MKEFIKNNYIYVLIIVIALIIRAYFFIIIAVEGPSMEPNLKQGQIMLLNKRAYLKEKPKRFDIIVTKVEGVRIIKRIIGLPGEIVKYENNKLYINNQEVKTNIQFTKTGNFPREIRVRDGYYFIMGDNRSASVDSRIFGSIKESEIIGNVHISLIPYQKY